MPSPTSWRGSGKTSSIGLLGQDRAAGGDPPDQRDVGGLRARVADAGLVVKRSAGRPGRRPGRESGPRSPGDGWGRGAASPCARARRAGGTRWTSWSARPPRRSRACSGGSPCARPPSGSPRGPCADGGSARTRRPARRGSRSPCCLALPPLPSPLLMVETVAISTLKFKHLFEESWILSDGWGRTSYRCSIERTFDGGFDAGGPDERDDVDGLPAADGSAGSAGAPGSGCPTEAARGRGRSGSADPARAPGRPGGCCSGCSSASWPSRWRRQPPRVTGATTSWPSG